MAVCIRCGHTKLTERQCGNCGAFGNAPALQPKDTTMSMNVDREMPKYRSHKEVWALKIASIEFDRAKADAEGRETDGSATITPAEEGYAPFKVDAAYVKKHEPKAGGYYVVYQDGYKSWSPADAFESGNTRI